MKLTDSIPSEARLGIVIALKSHKKATGHDLTPYFEKLLASEQAWKEEAEMFKRLFEGEMDLRHKWMDEAHENKDKLNQAVEVLEWIRDSGTDYQSNSRAANFLASLALETEQ